MKKLVLLAIAIVAGIAIRNKIQRDRENAELWAEVTDSFGDDLPAAA